MGSSIYKPPARSWWPRPVAIVARPIRRRPGGPRWGAWVEHAQAVQGRRRLAQSHAVSTGNSVYLNCTNWPLLMPPSHYNRHIHILRNSHLSNDIVVECNPYRKSGVSCVPTRQRYDAIRLQQGSEPPLAIPIVTVPFFPRKLLLGRRTPLAALALGARRLTKLN